MGRYGQFCRSVLVNVLNHSFHIIFITSGVKGMLLVGSITAESTVTTHVKFRATRWKESTGLQRTGRPIPTSVNMWEV